MSGMMPERWNPVTGSTEKLAVWREVKDATELPLNLGPAESAFIVFHPPKGADPIVSVKQAGMELFPALMKSKTNTLTNATRDEVSHLADWKLTTDASGTIRLQTDIAGKFTATTASGKTWKVEAPALPAPIVVSGGWKVDYQSERGAPATAEFPRLISWSDHEDQGIRYFAGHATYHNQVTVPPTLLGPDRRLLLNLGGVEVIAQVKVNGQDCGILWHSPYEVDVTDKLQAGTNELEIRVVNLWPNRIIGDLRNPNAKPFTFSQSQLYSAKDALLPSGLLGPVELRAISDQPFSTAKR